MGPKVAVVTGANKGIGLAIVRALCKQFEGDVFLTARNETLGKEAVGQLEAEGLKPKFHRLDLLDTESMEELKKFLMDGYGGLDVLVNNAGVAFNVNSTVPFGKQAEDSIKTNYIGTLDVCNALFPILRPHSRVVHVSSFVGAMALQKCSEYNRKRLTAQDLTIPQLTSILQEFIEAAKNDRVGEGGWCNTAYGMSKVGVTSLAILQQKAFDTDPRDDIVVNAVHPGHVDTDMSSHTGPLNTDQGADNLVFLALLPAGVKEPRGKFISKKEIQPWHA